MGWDHFVWEGAGNCETRNDTEKPSFDEPADPVLQVKTMLKVRRDDGKTNGFRPGRTVCVDNLGWGFNVAALEEELRSKLIGVQDVRFATASVVPAGGVFYGGWGCVEFESYEQAVKGLVALDSMYIRIPGCPVPRPLIAHFPFWTESGRDVDAQAFDFGYFEITSPQGKQYKPVSAHFAQLNNMGALGLEWAEKDEARQSLKDKVRRQYITTLTKSMRDTLPADAVLTMVREDTTAPHASRTFWLRGVASLVKVEEIRNWFSQFDGVDKVHRLMDPVTLKPNGHVVVTIKCEKKAQLLKHQFETSLLLIGGVRPIRSNLTCRLRGPTGFEGVFDEALAAACGVPVECLPRVGGVITTSDRLSPSEHSCAQECRKILEKCACLRGMIFQGAMKMLRELHERQLKDLVDECGKLEFLTKLLANVERKQCHRKRDNPRRSERQKFRRHS